MTTARKQALDSLRSEDLLGLGMEADALRRTLHPEGVVTYSLHRELACAVPAAQRQSLPAITPHALSFEDVYATLPDAQQGNVGGLVLRGVSSVEQTAEQTLDAWEELLAGILKRVPSLWIHGLSAAAVLSIAQGSGLTPRTVLERLRDAGLRSLSGTEATILDDAFATPLRSVSPSDWLAVHRAAHQAGLPSTAAFRFGMGESPEQRIHHLEQLHRLQEETGGFLAVTTASFRPGAAMPAPAGWEEATAVESLKMLAVTRLFLSNIPNVAMDCSALSLKVLQTGLHFGSNDIGSIFAGAIGPSPNLPSEEDYRRVIRDAGLRPVQRDTGYTTWSF